MKACVVLAVLLVAFAVATSTADLGHTEASLRVRRETIRGPEFPNRCVFYECIASCRQRGYKSGGYCTINGCQCLR
uniref:Gallerimycin n=1 Tax=Spodoptera frugiperda TaxID=7108 RepID=Q6XD81_SPOFR|nr:gallerimycin [Spodoptera frugiperda]AAQ18896.1 gallerimycin [Spodoptera frugiperda]